MALPQIDIQIGNGALGLTIPTNDALAGMILQGPTPSGVALQTPKLITSLSGAEDLGINSAYDSDNSLVAHRAIKDFYDAAGTGAQLWIMVVPQANSMTTVFDKTQVGLAVRLLNAASGGIRLLTIVREPAGGYSPTLTNGMDEDVITAMVNAQALAEEFASNYKPLRIIIPAYRYTGVPADLPDLKQRSDNRVAILIGDKVASGTGTGTGILLGRLASIPVQRNIGRVKSGALPITTAYIGADTVEAATDDIQPLHDKGYITLRQHVGFAGYYFTDDPTATAATDDYSQIALGRVIDKAIFLAYQVYVNELLDEILIDQSSGQISRSQAKYLQQIAQSAIDNAMTANNEISGVTVEVDPAQDVLATSKIVVKLRIVPVGYAREIEVELGFSNPNN